MIHSIATRKITAFLFTMAWLAFVGQGTSYGQSPIAEGKIYWTGLESGIYRSSLGGSNVEQLVKPELRYPADIALDVLRGKMYWTDARWWVGGIHWSDLDGSNLKPFLGWGATNIALDIDGGKIYWTGVGGLDEYNFVARANLDGSNIEVLSEGGSPRDIALDSVRGKVYWTEWDDDRIFRADLDGQNVEYDYIRSGSPRGIALDLDGDKIYWTGWTDTGTIQRADLDGQNIEEILTVSDGYPEEITLDLDRGKVYWTNPGTQTIQRADLNGENVEHLFNLEDDAKPQLGSRAGIALDLDGGKIYWTDSGPGTIQCADLDGENREVLFDPIVREPHGIALDMDKMYWTDVAKGTIQQADLNGENIEVLITGLNRPKDIALLDKNKIYWTDEGTGEYWAEPETGKIQAANWDGSNVKDVLTGLSYPEDIVLDAIRGKIYWTDTDTGLMKRIIQQADLDGANVEAISTGLADHPTDIALDVDGSKIYWMDSIPDTMAIQRADLDGANIEEVFTFHQGSWNTYNAFALDLVGNKIYWSGVASWPAAGREGSEKRAEIFRSNLDGSHVGKIYYMFLGLVNIGTPQDIALDIPHPTSVSTPGTTPAIPATSGLSPNFPNPFNASTQIAYHLATPGPVRLTIYNTLGQPVHTLVNQFQPAGSYQVRWDARDQRGRALAAGVYLVRLHYPGGEQTRRLLLLK